MRRYLYIALTAAWVLSMPVLAGETAGGPSKEAAAASVSEEITGSTKDETDEKKEAGKASPENSQTEEQEKESETASSKNAEKTFEEKLEEIRIIRPEDARPGSYEKTGDHIMKCFMLKEYDKVFQFCNPDFIGDLGGYPQSLEMLWNQLLESFGPVLEIQYKGMSEDDSMTVISYTLLFEKKESVFAVVLDENNQLANVAVLSSRDRKDLPDKNDHPDE